MHRVYYLQKCLWWITGHLIVKTNPVCHQAGASLDISVEKNCKALCTDYSALAYISLALYNYSPNHHIEYSGHFPRWQLLHYISNCYTIL